MDAATAAEIAAWQYEPPYDFYDLAADPDDLRAFTDPADWDNTVAVADGDGTVVGFFEFTPSSRGVAVGLEMAPELTGRGLGTAFLAAGLEYVRDRSAQPRSSSRSPRGTNAPSECTSDSGSGGSARRSARRTAAVTSSQ
jgi:RimJ/RimL family protein N-acetyltransferase